VIDGSPLGRELAQWQENGRVASLWLRDDDAEAPTPALDSLLAITAAHGASVLVAVIPARTGVALAERLSREIHVEPAVHGVSHVSYAAAAEKKAELGTGRPIEAILAELAEARQRMATLFPTLSGLLVPPWNRIAPAVARRIGEAGFAAISAFGWKPIAADVRQLNTHVDLIDWKAQGRWRDYDEVSALLAGALQMSRQSHGFAPVGVLSHHLRRTVASDRVLDRLIRETAAHPAVRWTSARALLKATG
jgi:hypothetical protein